MLFFYLIASLLFSIWKGNCAVILDKYKFNLTTLSNQSMIKYQHGSKKYYIKLCSENTESTESDIFVYQCSLNNDNCHSIATRNNMNYYPRNSQNFSEGLIYFANSDPFSDDNGKTYKNFRVEFDLKCDPSIIGLGNIEIIFDELTNNMMIIKCSSSVACPTIVPSPIPIPYFQPHCVVTNRIQNNNTYGINTNFLDLNRESFGIKTDLFINNQQKTLFYQPCGRMTCPPSYSCSTDYSSAWLCYNQGSKRYCDSYGIIDNNTNFYPVDLFELNKGIILHFEEKSSKRSVNLTLTCEKSNFPKNHIKWTNNASIINKTLLIFGTTPDVCVKSLQIPKTRIIQKDSEQTKTSNNSEKNTESISLEFDESFSSTTETLKSSTSTIEQATSSSDTENDSTQNIEDSTIEINYTPSIEESSEKLIETESSEKLIETESSEKLIETESSEKLIETESETSTIDSNFTPSNEKSSSILITTESSENSHDITDDFIVTSTTTASITVEPSSSETESSNSDDSTTESSSTDDGDDDGESGDEKKKNKRFWMIIPIFIGAALFFYFVVGTIFVSIRDRSCHLPNRRFWRRCGKKCSKKEQEYTFKLISDSD